MSEEVQFEEDQLSMPHRPAGQRAPTSYAAARYEQTQSTASGMTGWLVRHGFINSDSGAKVILGAIVCINFIAAGLIMYFLVLH